MIEARWLDPRPLAERIARYAHRNQTDKAGRPYIEHVERVVTNLIRTWPHATPDEISAAWLHDTLEDTAWTAKLLREIGIPPAVVQVIEEVARPPGSTYLQWIKDVASSGSFSAVMVKFADCEDNCSPERVAAIAEGPRLLEQRYGPAKRLLEARIGMDRDDAI